MEDSWADCVFSIVFHLPKHTGVAEKKRESDFIEESERVVVEI